MDAPTDRTYTLREVRETGKAAWKEDYLFVNGEIIRVVAIPDGGAYRVRFRVSSLDESHAAVQEGWRLVSSLIEAGQRQAEPAAC